jgi:hypothetical protein
VTHEIICHTKALLRAATDQKLIFSWIRVMDNHWTVVTNDHRAVPHSDASIREYADMLALADVEPLYV